MFRLPIGHVIVYIYAVHLERFVWRCDTVMLRSCLSLIARSNSLYVFLGLIVQFHLFFGIGVAAFTMAAS